MLWAGEGTAMASVSFNRNRVKLKALLGIRARLALLALILTCPLMLERARSLEDTRARQIAAASQEFANLAQHSANAQREVISSVEALLKSAAYIRASAGGIGKSCLILRGSLQVELPWIANMSVVGRDGRVQCSTLNALVGADVSDRPYFQRMRETGGFVLSDYLFGRGVKKPTIIAGYPVAAIDPDEDAFVVAAVNLDWMSLTMGNLGGRPGVSAVMVDSIGTVIAAPPDQASMIGRSLEQLPLLSAIAEQALHADKSNGTVSFTAADGSKRAASFARVAGTNSRLIVSIDEAKVSAGINRDIRTAYLQLAFVCVFVLIGALIAAEKLIIQPIEIMAGMTRKFSQGDWSARVSRARLPAEFVPLARAFNAMAAHLGQRERELIATNDRLTVIASIDMLSGLANRRGFQSRLDFEWLKAMQSSSELALLMIDVDHFKLYNDGYGHPEGDVCLSRLGETLAAIADQTNGFAGRYGGEEFCLLLPDCTAARALSVGETVRAAVQDLRMPHATSAYQCVTVSVGVACTTPSDAQAPKDLIEAADAALYAAKHRGRNAVVEHGLVRAGDASGMAIAS